MSIEDVRPEELAKLFHLYHRALSQGLDNHGRQEVRSWDQTSESERRLMVSAARLALLDLAAASREKQPTREYFAIPGEADWGC